MTSAGTLNSRLAARPPGKEETQIQPAMESEQVLEQILEIRGESDRHGHVGDGVLENEVPADDPGDQLAEDGVRVCIRAAGDGNHRCKFRIAEAGETARHGYQQEGDCDGRPGARASELRRSSAVEEKVNDGCNRLTTLPAAAVPVSVKMPLPMTAPIPRNVRLQGPSVLRSAL